jgi:hypothetical protein
MRLPRAHSDHPSVPWQALVAIALAVPPAGLHAALASAAGTLFEAAPFVLAAEVLPARRLAALEGAGCGCGRRGIPGAVSLPATALCWLAFGPWVALARFAAGVVLARWKGRPGKGARSPDGSERDPLAALVRLVVPAILASLAAQTIAAHAAGLRSAWPPLLFLGGACLGVLVPCATAGVAIAAGFAQPLPLTAAGMLVTAGLVTLRARPACRPVAAAVTRHAGCASGLLALALAAIVWRGPSGLVSPRLLPLDAMGAALALAGIGRRRTRAAAAPLLGIALGCALAAGYAVPPDVASETTLGAAYPGERIDFTGVAHATGSGTTLERFAIACCRLDATPVAVRLTQRVALPDGRWVTVRGIVIRKGSALLVRPDWWRPVPAPADPFVYR